MRTAMLLVLLLAACGGNSSSVDMAVADLTILPPDMVPTVPLSLDTFKLGVAGRLEGTTICLYPSTTQCTTTTTTAPARLDVPANVDLQLTFNNPGYYPLIASVSMPNKPLSLGYILNDTAAMQAKANAAGFTLDPTKAIVETQGALLSGMGSPTGVTMSLAPSAGKPAVYLDTTHTPDPSLTGTSKDGTAWFGEVPPGEYDVTYNDPNGACSHVYYGWAGSAAGHTRVNAVAGYLSNTGAGCP